MENKSIIVDEMKKEKAASQKEIIRLCEIEAIIDDTYVRAQLDLINWALANLSLSLSDAKILYKRINEAVEMRKRKNEDFKLKVLDNNLNETMLEPIKTNCAVLFIELANLYLERVNQLKDDINCESNFFRFIE